MIMGRRLDPSVAAKTMRSAGLDPLAPYPGSGKPWFCRCRTCGAEVTPRYSSIGQGQGGCRYCAGNAPLAPEAAAEKMRAAGFEPLVPYLGSSKPWRSRCVICGAESTPCYSNVQQGNRCRYCAGNVPLDPQVAAGMMRAAGVEPLAAYPGSGKPWPCRCLDCGAEVSPSYASIQQGQGGCRFCAGKVIEERVAVEVMLSAGLEPLVPYAGANAPWPCRCDACGAQVSPSYSNVRNGNGGCKFCAGNALLDHQVAAERMRAAGLEPLVAYSGRHKPWRCRCMTCGLEVSPAYGGIQSGQGGCRYCAGKAVDPEAAVELMRAAGLEPLVPYPGGGEPWLSRCTSCDAEVAPRYAGVRAGQGGCRPCAWNLSLPGRSMGVYLMTNEALGAVKVGIGVVNADRFPRIAIHRLYGWDLYAEWRTVPGLRAARAVERHILHRWDTEGIRGFLRAEHMPQSGFSETAPLSRVNLDDLVGGITLAIGRYSDSLGFDLVPDSEPMERSGAA